MWGNRFQLCCNGNGLHGNFLCFGIISLLQAVTNPPTGFRVKQLAENLPFFNGIGEQKPPEFPLCNHHNLLKLCAFHTDAFGNFTGNRFKAAANASLFSVRQQLIQRCICLLFHCSNSTLFLPFIGWVSLHQISFPIVQKFQANFRFCGTVGQILTAELSGFPF